MDTITQGLLGAAIAEVGFRSRLGRRATAFGAFCGMLPDADFAALVKDEWAAMGTHRGLTHSLLVLTVAALPMGLLARRWLDRKGPAWAWVHLAFWALITHPLLDLCTAYGTQLFAPISATRFALDAVSPVDPWYSVPLLLVVAAAQWGPWTPTRRRRMVVVGLAISHLYLAQGYVQSRRALALAEIDLQRAGFAPVEVRAMPLLFQTMLFRVVARDAAGNLRYGGISTLHPTPIEFYAFDRPDDVRVTRALQSERGRFFRWFADDMVAATIDPRHGTVDLRDLRYGLLSEPGTTPFRMRVDFDQRQRVAAVQRIPWERDSELPAAVWQIYRWTIWGIPGPLPAITAPSAATLPGRGQPADQVARPSAL